jgi:hypothetical protein
MTGALAITGLGGASGGESGLGGRRERVGVPGLAWSE